MKSEEQLNTKYEFTERLENIKEIHTTVEAFLGFVSDCKSQFESSEVKTEELKNSVYSKIATVQILFEVKALYFLTLVKQQVWGLEYYRDSVI